MSTIATRPFEATGAVVAERRRQFVRLFGLWSFLATVTMLFGAFTSAYIVRQASVDWQPLALPPVLWLNTVLLALSSVALEVARYDARRERWSKAAGSVVVAAILGVAFLIGQLAAWRFLVARGIYVPTNPHSSFFYILTGIHGLHLLAGLVLLSVVAVRSWRRSGDAQADRPSADARRLPTGRGQDTAGSLGLLDIGATFWHFFGVLWVYLFAVLFLV